MKDPRNKLTIAAMVALSASLIAGCGSDEDEIGPAAGANSGGGVAVATAQPVITDEARTEAKQIFASRCATCHGERGQGDGPGAANLDPKPRNYHDKAWQATVTDEEIEKTIVYGGAAVGKSPQMVPNPDLGSKPVIVAALREMVRTFGDEPVDTSEAPQDGSPEATEPTEAN